MDARQKNKDYVPALGYDFLTRFYDPAVALTARERTFKRLLIDQARLGDAETLLDLGCGSGTLAIRIAKEHPGIDITGLDGDRKILSIARRKAKRAGARARFDHGMSFELPYPEASFDRVLSSLFFHHLTTEDKKRTIAEVRRVLKPGGEVHVADWGRPTGWAMGLLSRSIRLLDGAERTAVNLAGRLPGLFEMGGFRDVSTTRELSTVFGTLSLFRGVRP